MPDTSCFSDGHIGIAQLKMAAKKMRDLEIIRFEQFKRLRKIKIGNEKVGEIERLKQIKRYRIYIGVFLATGCIAAMLGGAADPAQCDTMREITASGWPDLVSTRIGCALRCRVAI